MPSLAQGYEYDIFISYRQKDNRSDQWVTNFVKTLREELGTTFKDEISIYFDANPHDGLHDYQEVDDSLKHKLRSLILIPIVSRTYCDTKAFAWEHELKAFLQLAADDSFGLKTKLGGGNVASRVLPVRIHDIKKEDIELFEATTGSVLRPIDFVYKELGVNRALTPQDDRNINQEKTDYRNQVNKVAHAIGEILDSLRSGGQTSAQSNMVTGTAAAEIPSKSQRLDQAGKSSWTAAPKIVEAVRKGLVPVLLILVGAAAALSIRDYFEAPLKIPPRLAYEVKFPSAMAYRGRHSLALSPQGDYLAFVGDGIFLKSLTQDTEPVRIQSKMQAREIFFSPDGQWIGFEGDKRAIYKIPVHGGEPVKLCDLQYGIGGANWYKNQILYIDGDKDIFSISPNGGNPKKVFEVMDLDAGGVAGDDYIWNPQLTADNQYIVFSKTQKEATSIWLLSLKDSQSILLIEKGRDARILDPDQLVYVENHQLYKQRVDWAAKQITGPAEGIKTNKILFALASGQFDMSTNGILAYAQFEQRDNNREVVWVYPDGKVEEITRNTLQGLFSPKISPDGKHIVVDYNDETYKMELIDVALGTLSSFKGGTDSFRPVWYPDNTSVSYSTGRNLFLRPIDFSREPEKLAETDGFAILGNWSPDGRYLVFEVQTAKRNSDIGYYDRLDSTVVMLDAINTGRDEIAPVISPDGKWLAFSSDRDATQHAYVVSFPHPGELHQISTSTGYSSVWAPDMSAIYFLEGGQAPTNYFTNRTSGNAPAETAMYKVKISTLGKFTSGSPIKLFKSNNFRNYGGSIEGSTWGLFDIHPEGKKFLMIRWSEQQSEQQVIGTVKVIANWEQPEDK